ncbi:hypothetical protein CS542_04600 [Pedobacter sp. IW39]|nr:hypothetical protein CS542_04600 [Pedobacter sp. IW39]
MYFSPQIFTITAAIRWLPINNQFSQHGPTTVIMMISNRPEPSPIPFSTEQQFYSAGYPALCLQ